MVRKNDVPVAKTVVIVPPIKKTRQELVLIGIDRLVMHNVASYARRASGGPGRAKQPTIPTPDQEYEESLYCEDLKDPAHTLYFPAIGFKKSAVEAATSLGKGIISKTLVRQAVHVQGDKVRIYGKLGRREDIVRVGRASVVRWRAEVMNWYCKIEVIYNAGAMSAETLLNLFNTAGFGVGIGENRPGKSGGSWGTFYVASEAEAAKLRWK